MPWDDRDNKQHAIDHANRVYNFESPFPDYAELENNKSIIKKFSFGGEDKLGLGIKDIDASLIDNIFKKYIDEWNPSSGQERLFFTKNPTFNLSYPEFDAFVLYSFIRHYQPKNIIEIGSGQSTRVMIEAIIKNNNGCQLTCIEPYNDSIVLLNEIYPINIIKQKVEMVDIDLFSSLGANDILFIDSSHVFKPFGDIEYEYLHILPMLKEGCLVHIHDIFYPYDYPQNWVLDWKCVLTEQPFLIAFLHGNSNWKCLCANNYLLNDKLDIVPEKIEYKCGGSFWIHKV